MPAPICSRSAWCCTKWRPAPTPFHGDSPGLIFDAILNRAPASAVRLNPELPQELERIIAKCLEKDRELRYQHASEIRADLQRLKRDRDSGRLTVAHDARAPRCSRAAGRCGWRPAAAASSRPPSRVRSTAAVRATLTDKDTIVLADFTNTTGDPVFDDTLRQGLAVQLQQSPFLSLVSDERIRQNAAADEPAGGCATDPRHRAGGVRPDRQRRRLEGSIATLGSQYVLGLRAKNCTTGDILADEQAQAARKEEVLGALSQIASPIPDASRGIARHHRETLDAARGSDDAVAGSAEGLQRRVEERTHVSGGAERRMPLFERAIAIDPDFAMAHARLGIGYSALGESTLARQSTLKAYQLRDRASDVERFFIDTLYDRQVTGNLEREQRTLESWAQTYPRDPILTDCCRVSPRSAPADMSCRSPKPTRPSLSILTGRPAYDNQSLQSALS